MINKLLFFMIFVVSPVWAQKQNFDLSYLTGLPALPANSTQIIAASALPDVYPLTVSAPTSANVPANSDTWNSVIRFLIDLQVTREAELPLIYVNESVPIKVEKRYGTEQEDAATAARSYVDDLTTGCRITINAESSAWSEAMLAISRRTSRKNAIDTIKARPDKRRNFLVMHEVGHCFDNERTTLNGDDFYVWKELFADVFAVVNSRASGVPASAFDNVGRVRGLDVSPQNSIAWQTAIEKSSTVTIPSSIEEIVTLTKEIRKNVWRH